MGKTCSYTAYPFPSGFLKTKELRHDLYLKSGNTGVISKILQTKHFTGPAPSSQPTLLFSKNRESRCTERPIRRDARRVRPRHQCFSMQLSKTKGHTTQLKS